MKQRSPDDLLKQIVDMRLTHVTQEGSPIVWLTMDGVKIARFPNTKRGMERLGSFVEDLLCLSEEEAEAVRKWVAP